MMKKNLNVDAMILDLRNVQEDFLDRYEQIKLDCMIALTSPRVQTLLSQHNISLDSMLCKNVPEEVSGVWSMARSRGALPARPPPGRYWWSTAS